GRRKGQGRRTDTGDCECYLDYGSGGWLRVGGRTLYIASALQVGLLQCGRLPEAEGRRDEETQRETDGDSLGRHGGTQGMTQRKQKLELTWIGKEVRPKLEPRILLEDPARSHIAATRVTKSDIFDNRLIFGD